MCDAFQRVLSALSFPPPRNSVVGQLVESRWLLMLYGSVCMVDVGRHGLRSICRSHLSPVSVVSRHPHLSVLVRNQVGALSRPAFVSQTRSTDWHWRHFQGCQLSSWTTRNENNHDRILSHRYRAEHSARRLSLYRKSPVSHVHAIQDTA